MKRSAIIFIVILLVILTIVIMNSLSVNVNSKSTSSSDNIINLNTKENSEGSVTITVTSLNLKDNSSSWNFEIGLDTHSGALDADLVATSELLDDQGKTYKAISWKGDNPGGHHRKGILKFNPISPHPKFVELKIKNVGGILERSFKWNF